MRIGASHKFAGAVGNCFFELFQHVGRKQSHLLNGIAGSLENIFCVREIFSHGVKRQLIAVADYKLILIRIEVSIV